MLYMPPDHDAMRICGILSWYDESPTWLAAAASGFARFCDQIVAVDGAYAAYPGARPRSHPNQAEVVLQVCEAAGIGCTVHRPRDVWWGHEVEKRNFCLRLAGSSLVDDRDWVVVFDADLHVLKCEPANVRAALENTDALIATYTALDGMDYMSDAKLAEYANRVDLDTEWTSRTADIYRWHHSLRYGPAHWTVSREWEGERLWLRAPADAAKAQPVNLNADLAVYHRTADRSNIRRESANQYYRLRNELGLEPEGHLFDVREEQTA
jgi:hypothetical protein